MEKAHFVQNMFQSIAPRYDFLNWLLSAGRDSYWRQMAINELPLGAGGTFLDVATGTGDIAIKIAENAPETVKVVGVDFSEKMLDVGREKINQKGLKNQIELKYGDATDLPFDDNSFEGAITAFGLRNFSNLEKGLKEMLRVVKPGGKVVILEFTNPENPVFRWLYYSYFRYILPIIGGLISGNSSAYQYLPDSVLNFPSCNNLMKIMGECGIKKVKYRVLTFGIANLHIGENI